MNILVICLAQVLLSSILLFAYFKTRVSKVEEKLDIMFQLVQSHTAQQNSMKFYENNKINNEVDNQLDKRDVNLITVSDDDIDESEDSDSDGEDSDGEDSDDELNELVIGQNIKKISLNLVNSEENEDVSIILEKKNNVEILSNKDLNEDLNKDLNEDLNEDLTEDLTGEILQEVSVDNFSIEEIDYDQFKVSELKKICEEKGLENYKKLRKNELIELLKKN
jgi:hypothetical protein